MIGLLLLPFRLVFWLLSIPLKIVWFAVKMVLLLVWWIPKTALRALWFLPKTSFRTVRTVGLAGLLACGAGIAAGYVLGSRQQSPSA